MTTASDHRPSTAGAAPADADTAAKIEKLIEAEEGAANRAVGRVAAVITALAAVVSLAHLYAAYDVVSAQVLRPLHVGAVLVLVFLVFPMARRFRDRVHIWDWALAALSAAAVGYILAQGPEFGDRAVTPTAWDYAVGVALIALLLEATRRSTGPIMPGVAIVFLLYALFGNKLPAPWTHRGYPAEDLVAHLYMTLEGIFGPTVDVSSSLIILFTIFGAVLSQSGAGKFFIDVSFAAMGGQRNAAGRAVVLSSFLMGGPSGSGVATTVTIGTVAYPLLAKAGYGREAAGGLLAAGGLGAIISPPVLGAAAFLIAEFLKISYFDVILMAVIPTLLFYLSIVVMVEIDARKHHGTGGELPVRQPLGALILGYGFHFGSLVSIIAFMLLGYSPVLSVVGGTLIAVALCALRDETAIVPRWAAALLGLSIVVPLAELAGIRLPYARWIVSIAVLGTLALVAAGALLRQGSSGAPARLLAALRDGTIGVLNVATTCATAGIIVGVTTLTGLAQRFADIIIGYAGGSLLLTAVYSAAIVWVVGLAVPVTASYIMCAVIAAPALIKLGVPDFAAHMFIFYYAVLSEVSPPTALSPFAAAAITGGDPYRTTLQSWKYTMPAFLVPFAFVLDPAGVGLLLQLPKGGSAADAVLLAASVCLGIVLLAIGAQRHLVGPATALESGLCIGAGLALTLPAAVEALLAVAGLGTGLPVPAVGLALGVLGVLMHVIRAAAANGGVNRTGEPR